MMVSMERGPGLLRAVRSLGVRGALSQPLLRRFCTDGRVGEIGEISGIPEKHRQRKVVIYSPARTSMQQGSGKTGKWKINFLSTDKWENPLMGWTSTGDPYTSLGESALVFDNKEAAIQFAEKYGWEYMIKEPHLPVLKAKSYADNFKFRPLPAAED